MNPVEAVRYTSFGQQKDKVCICLCKYIHTVYCKCEKISWAKLSHFLWVISRALWKFLRECLFIRTYTYMSFV